MATNQTYIIAVLFVLLIFIIRQLLSGIKSRGSIVATEPAAVDPAATPHFSTGKWWHKLPPEKQSALAIDAAGWCLPLWASYLAAHKSSVRPHSSATGISIDDNLLKSALDAVRSHHSSGFSKENELLLRKTYTNLLEPMVALQDGNWIIPYPLKKLFTGVYTMVEGALLPEAGDDHRGRIIESIGHSMDCLELSRLYDEAEMQRLLSPYLMVPENDGAGLPLNASCTP